MEKIIIAALTKGRVIGKNNWLPWDIPEELQHFRKTTENGTIIMGRRTYDSIGRPMPKRVNIVVSAHVKQVNNDSVIVCPTVEAAISKAETFGKQIFIIGGAQIFQQALDKKLVDKMYLSYIKKEYDGDTYFPEFDESEWTVESKEPHEQFEIVKYRRK